MLNCKVKIEFKTFAHICSVRHESDFEDKKHEIIMSLSKNPTLAFYCFFHCVVRLGYDREALRLCEQYHDFRTLVYMLEENWRRIGDKKTHISHYLITFGRPFSFALFEYLLANGKNRYTCYYNLTYTGRYGDLLTCNEESEGYLKEFLDQKKQYNLSWLHDIYLDQYESAQAASYISACRATRLNRKRVCLLQRPVSSLIV